MVTFAELRSAKPQLWTTAAQDLRKAGQQCDRVEDDIHNNGVHPLTDAWDDHVGQLAVEVLKNIATKAETTSILARTGAEPVDALAHAVRTAQTELENGVSLAESNGLKVDPATGKVSLPKTLGRNDNPTAMFLTMNQAQRLIDDAIEAATQANNLCAEALQKASGSVVNPETTKGQAQDVQKLAVKNALEEIRDTLPDGLSSSQVRMWWNGLTPGEQFNLERAAPTELMNLDGIPEDVRTRIDRPDLGYSSAGTVDYAKRNVENGRLDWKPPLDNCTSFVSNSLRYGGGMKTKEDPYGLGPVVPTEHFNQDAWTDNGRGGEDPWDPGFGSYSPTWGAAQNNHDFFLNHGGTVVSDPNQIRPGDVVYWKMTDGEVHHAAVVTGVLPDGEILYTQHSDAGLNYPLNGRLPEFEQNYGKQTIDVVRPKVTW
ncbi:Putative amidase domain [Mycobacteroides abscessus subsp. bolletii]|uniref:amidase domain-containing protein n=1 Tax=Mycobacteroides abscessus TaxID=36809 RepID=UPI0009287F66|nr:amidase domain-containing protein [Mycobacteroides abscessus]SHY88862.1 Putative amidase domain [Mycobacteroides abscessus subsp. bolletii]SHZ09067.1 Putative amidase domain [Mycobacteroides abscessus subsp. bolletii]